MIFIYMHVYIYKGIFVNKYLYIVIIVLCFLHQKKY